MDPTSPKLWLVILLGIISTTQNHLAKAFQRQGIETLDHVRSKTKLAGAPLRYRPKKAWIYALGLILNQTVFIYHLFTTPLGGTTAVYTSMYGVGLLVLLLYSWKVLKEPLSRTELSGALAIFAGTLAIGLEGFYRPVLNMAWMDFDATLLAVGILGVICILVMYVSLRNGSKDAIGMGFGFSAGAIGALDPFLKGVGQTAGGGSALHPISGAGWVVFAASFGIGMLAFLIDQWGFYKRVRTNILVPTFNASYIAVPVILQTILLPGYHFYWTTFFGLGLLMLGFVILGNFNTHPQPHSEPNA
jgi:drug/metabolite transporter (DMT)-like permease